MIRAEVFEAIESTDTDALLRAVEGMCKAKAWDDLVELRVRCGEAVGRGKQVWGVEEHIRYRLVLEAPPSYVGPVVAEGNSRLLLGPLPEVAASRLNWSDLSPVLPDGPEKETFAAERVLRGEVIDTPITGLPSRLQDWEPDYPVARYKPNKVEAPPPSLPDLDPVPMPSDPNQVSDAATEGALADLVEPWTDQSNGRCQTVTVDGRAVDAISALGVPEARMGRLSLAEATAWTCWAAASGGAHGRRRGAAAGRFLTWWLLATIADLDWPANPTELKTSSESLGFYWFDDSSPEIGWTLRLAIESPTEGLAWAVSASDIAD